MRQDTFSRKAADELLRERASQWRVENWPGPIAQYIVGTATEEKVRQKAVSGSSDPTDPNPNSWQFHFYKLLKTSVSAADGIQVLESGLQHLLNVKGSEYLDGEKFFYFLRLEEFYIARDWTSKRSGRRLT